MQFFFYIIFVVLVKYHDINRHYHCIKALQHALPLVDLSVNVIWVMSQGLVVKMFAMLQCGQTAGHKAHNF